MTLVSRFKAYDIVSDTFVVSDRWATPQVIEKLRVEGAVLGTEIEVDPSILDDNGLTPKGFVPS